MYITVIMPGDNPEETRRATVLEIPCDRQNDTGTLLYTSKQVTDTKIVLKSILQSAINTIEKNNTDIGSELSRMMPSVSVPETPVQSATLPGSSPVESTEDVYCPCRKKLRLHTGAPFSYKPYLDMAQRRNFEVGGRQNPINILDEPMFSEDEYSSPILSLRDQLGGIKDHNDQPVVVIQYAPTQEIDASKLNSIPIRNKSRCLGSRGKLPVNKLDRNNLIEISDSDDDIDKDSIALNSNRKTYSDESLSRFIKKYNFTDSLGNSGKQNINTEDPVTKLPKTFDMLYNMYLGQDETRQNDNIEYNSDSLEELARHTRLTNQTFKSKVNNVPILDLDDLYETSQQLLTTYTASNDTFITDGKKELFTEEFGKHFAMTNNNCSDGDSLKVSSALLHNEAKVSPKQENASPSRIQSITVDDAALQLSVANSTQGTFKQGNTMVDNFKIVYNNSNKFNSSDEKRVFNNTFLPADGNAGEPLTSIESQSFGEPGRHCFKQEGRNTLDKYFNGDPDYKITFDSLQKLASLDTKSISSTSSGDKSSSENKDVMPYIPMDTLDKLFDKMSEFEKDVPAEPSNKIRTKLLLHQKLALNWMIQKENTTELPPFWCEIPPHLYYHEISLEKSYNRPKCVNGGILADDMGLGKTLVLISLILTNHVNGKPMFPRKKRHSGLLGIEDDPFLEDVEAIENKNVKVKKNKDGFVKSHRKRNSTLKEPGKQFRKIFVDEMCKMRKKKKKRSKGENRKPDEKLAKGNKSNDLMVLSDSEDEFPDFSSHVRNLIKSPLLATEEPKREMKMFGEKPDGEKTLIVCPLSVLSNWTEQFESHLSPGTDIHIYIFYGAERVRDMNFLKQQDVIITTYLTLTNDFKMGTSLLHKINWLRVILDEGHCIRNPSAQQTKATRALRAERRWIVTGTPIQNRMTDFWSMLNFLKLEPFATRRWWTREVVAPIKRRYGDRPYFDRVQKIVRHVSIRRMKTDAVNGKPIIHLPEKTVNTETVKLGAEERALYDAMQKSVKHVIVKYFNRGARYLLRHYANVLATIMRLRQMCCHPALCKIAIREMQRQERLRAEAEAAGKDAQVEDGDEEGDENISEEERNRLIQQLIEIVNTGDSEDCAICLEALKEPVITRCAHVFCNGCITEVIESAELQSLCPMCRSDISVNELLRVPEKQKELEADTLEEFNEDDWETSTKIDCLVASLEDLRKTNPDVKSVVVSQFTSFLGLIEISLRARDFNYVRFDGSMTQRDRTTAIEEFNSSLDGSPTIMLLSLTAGGVGLNLTGGSRVFLMDPAWNPSIEDQCFDRCHRMGQTKEVIVTKYIVEDSIEERMVQLQQSKKDLINQAFGVKNQTAEQRTKARLETIMKLLDIDH